jgi:sialidase-1
VNRGRQGRFARRAAISTALLLSSFVAGSAFAQTDADESNAVENRYPIAEKQPPFLDDQVLFPEEPHAWYRIPSIVVAKSGVVLAFAERRLGTNHDWGHDSESVLRRSFDNGKTWGPIQTIISIKHLDPDSGPVVVDQQTGRIFRFFKWVSSAVRSPAQDTEAVEQMKQYGYASYEIHSDDDGVTWSEPRNINLATPLAASRLSVGNGNHGIQLRDGRLVMPAGWASEAKWASAGRYMRGGFAVSDDHGETWRIAGHYEGTKEDWEKYPETSPGGMQVEYNLLELSDGSIYVNSRAARNMEGKDSHHKWRTVLWSKDRGETMEGWRYEKTQVSGTHAGLERYDENRILMSFATLPMRVEQTVMLSPDEGKTWPVAKVVWHGPGGYSDLAVAKDKAILMIYEKSGMDAPPRGGNMPGGENEFIAIARFNLAWLTEQDPQRQPAPPTVE